MYDDGEEGGKGGDDEIPNSDHIRQSSSDYVSSLRNTSFGVNNEQARQSSSTVPLNQSISQE